MPLIKSNDIVTLRQYVKMNFTTTENVMPDMDAAERKFLIPILTQSVFNALQTQVDANDIDPAWVVLLNLCRAAVAPLAVWLQLPFMQVSITDSGLKKTVTNNTQGAYQWEYREIEQRLIGQGMAALEDLLTYLIASGNTFSWTNEEAKENIIRTGSEFSRLVFLDQPNLTFQQLLPLIREVQDHYIRSSIGDTFFEYLRDTSNPSEDESKVIKLLKKIVAQFTVVRAIETMPVRITPRGLMASIQDNSEAFNTDQPAKSEALIRRMQAAQREGDSYQAQLIDFLNVKASPTVFATFYTSEFYTAPAELIDRNDTRSGVCALN